MIKYSTIKRDRCKTERQWDVHGGLTVHKINERNCTEHSYRSSLQNLLLSTHKVEDNKL